jgi:hypothetical protein
MAFFHFELGNAVAQQTTGPIGTLENNDIVTSASELLCCSKSGWSRSDNRNPFTGANRRQLRFDPAFGPGTIDDLNLDLLDRDWILIDSDNTCCLTWGRAKPSGELREIIGRVQLIDRITPTIPENKIVPIRNQIAERTAVVAERNTAIHAPACLFTNLGDRKILVDLTPITKPDWNLTPARKLTLMLEKSCYITHDVPLSPSRCGHNRLDRIGSLSEGLSFSFKDPFEVLWYDLDEIGRFD